MPGSLAAIVGNMKSVLSCQINRLGDTLGAPAWQRNYYECTVRNERELNAMREYIEYNPMQCLLDRENPAAQGATRSREVKSS